MKKAPPMKGGKDFGPKEKGPLKNADSTKSKAVPPKSKAGGTDKQAAARDKFKAMKEFETIDKRQKYKEGESNKTQLT